MKNKSGKKSSRSRVDQVNITKYVCDYCNQQISGDITNCKCSFTFFCCNDCRRKSDHHKHCDGGNVKTFTADQIHEEVQRMKKRYYMVKFKQRKLFETELMSVAGKTFEELLEMKHEPVACLKIALSMMTNAEMYDTTPIICGLPEKYQTMTDIKRVKVAVNHLRRGADQDHLVCMYVLADTIFKYQDILHLDSREAMDLLVETARRGVTEAKKDLALHSPLIWGVNTLIDKFAKNTAKSCVSLVNKDFGSAYLVLQTSLDHIMDLTPEELEDQLDILQDDVGIEQINSLITLLKKSKKSFLNYEYPTYVPIKFESCRIPQEIKSRTSIRYTTPDINLDNAMNDFKKICEGLDSLDKVKRARYDCEHWFKVEKRKEASVTNLCRMCFLEAVARVRAVASKAFLMSTSRIEMETDNNFFGVIFQKNMLYDKSNLRRSCTFEVFQTCSKEELIVVLKLLSVNSADIDPRMLCINASLYWSIIWYYGSITAALLDVGGEQMYKKAFFGPHTNLEDPNNFIDPTILEGDNVQMWKNFMKYQKTHEEVRRRIEDPYTLETNLVSELEVEREWRYCCSYLGCFNLEDSRKFLNCSECVKVFKRKYCSVECQV